MLQRIRESLVLVLIAALPFHALFVTVTTKVFLGVNHEPFLGIALWKEGILSVVLLLVVGEFFSVARRMRPFTWDSIDLCIFLGFLYGCIRSLSLDVPVTQILFGIKYDFLPLLSFIFLRRVPWSDSFWRVAHTILLAVGVIVALYGFATLFLPFAYFTALGYSDLHSLYTPHGPLAAFQFLEGTAIRRMQSTFSGPNQLGLWLLLPLAISLARMRSKGFVWTVPFLTFFVAISLSFSRAALLAAIVMIVLTFFRTVRARTVLTLLFLAVSSCIALTFLFPAVFLRLQSTSDHFHRPIAALQVIATYPLGLGLGAAGPASNAVRDACVMLPENGSADWAKDRPDLCVFLGNTQVQPTTRACHCPFLTENWYLQLGVEMGLLGLVMSLLLPCIFFFRYRNFADYPMILSFLGLSIAALFLHAFEDSAVAYTLWILLAIISQRYRLQ